MPDSIERFVRGISVLRVLSYATLILVALCLIVSASIALAAGPVAIGPGASSHVTDDVKGATGIDIYEFDFRVEAETLPNPELEEGTTGREV